MLISVSPVTLASSNTDLGRLTTASYQSGISTANHILKLINQCFADHNFSPVFSSLHSR